MKKILNRFLVIFSMLLALTVTSSLSQNVEARYCVGPDCPESSFTFSYEGAEFRKFPTINSFLIDYTVSTIVHVDGNEHISSLDPVKVTLGDSFISSVGTRPWTIIGPNDKSYIHSSKYNATVDVSFQIRLNNSFCDEIHVVKNVK